LIKRYYAKTDHALHLMQVKVNESIPRTISFEDFRFSLLKGEFEFKNMLPEILSHVGT